MRGETEGRRERSAQRGPPRTQLLFKISRFGELVFPISIPSKSLGHIIEMVKVKFEKKKKKKKNKKKKKAEIARPH